MAIYLGETGSVEIGRQSSSDPVYTALVPADVTVSAKRFSFEYSAAVLTTGDYVQISRIQTGGNEQNLELVAGHEYPDWSGYVHVDGVGGLRLYGDIEAAIEGKKDPALDLVTPSTYQEVKLVTRAIDGRCLARLRSYEISTSRETVDTTVLSNQFREYLKNGLISGQGQLNCFWEHRLGICEDVCGPIEFSAYLARLCIRLQQGAGFKGKFYVFYGGSTESSVWYEAECVVTNVSISVDPTQLIESTIDFITSGPVTLRTGIEPMFLTQEDDYYVLQEDASKIVAASYDD